MIKTINIKFLVLFAAAISLALPVHITNAQVVDTNPAGNTPYCLQLNYNMGYRATDAMTNGEVSGLQDFLSANGYLSVQPTGYFGLLTIAAVTKFQSPTNGFSSASGYVGPYTQAKIKEITCSSTYSPSTANATVIIGNYPAGCSSNAGFSVTTGQSCSASNFPTGCTSTVGYSPTTGVKCDGSTSQTIEITIAPTYPAGCSSTAGYSSQTGARCDGTATATPSITVTSPNGGESYIVNQFATISWTKKDLDNRYQFDVLLRAYDVGGNRISGTHTSGNSSYTSSEFTIKNTGDSYSTTPSVLWEPSDFISQIRFNSQPAKYKVYIRESIDGGSFASDESDSFFTIVATSTAFPSGCSSNAGFSTTTGQSCSPYPVGCTSNAGYSSTTGASCSGTITTNQPSISSISPTQANLNTSTNVTIYGTNLSNTTSVQAYTSSGQWVASWPASNLSINSNSVSFNLGTWAYNASAATYQFKVVTSTGTSNGVNFTFISQQSSITVTSPNGGQVWTRGNTNDITWSYFGPSDKLVQIELALPAADGPLVATNIYASSGKYTWTIPSTITPRNDYRVIIREPSPTFTWLDASDSNFAIYLPGCTSTFGYSGTNGVACDGTSAPSITVTSPNGGENWVIGSTRNITWNIQGEVPSNWHTNPNGIPSVVIGLYKGNSFVQFISTQHVGGPAGFTVPNVAPGSDYKIKVSASGTGDIDLTVYDDSNNFFTIIPSITVTSPTAGQLWSSGASYAINWSTQGISSVRLYLLPVNSDGSLRANGIAITDYMDMPNGSHSYTYTVPTNQDGYNAIGFSYYDYGGTYNQKNSDVFTISSKACFAAGTKISMADGTYKNIEDIKVGDKVKSFDSSSFTIGTVVKTIERMDPIITINGVLRAAPDQVVYLANGGKSTADGLKVGDNLLNESGQAVAVTSVTFSPRLVQTYDFALDNGDAFYADGYLAKSLDHAIAFDNEFERASSLIQVLSK